MKKDNEYKSLLNGDEYEYNANEKKSGNSSLGKRTKLIIILVAFLLVIIPVYIFVLAPLLKTEDAPGTDTTKLPEPHYSEVIVNNKTLCMTALKSSDILSVSIRSKLPLKSGKYEYNDWQIKYDSESKAYTIENYKNGISYDSSSISTLMMYYSMMGVKDRIEFSSLNEINLSVYGLDEASMPTSYTVNMADGKSYKVTAGNPTSTNTGYYALYTDENGDVRPTVYIISTYFGSLINCTQYDLMSPTVFWALDSQNYTPSVYEFTRADGLDFIIKKLTDEELTEQERVKYSQLFTTIGGVDYEYDASADYSAMLYDSFVGGVNGSKVVYAKTDDLPAVPPAILDIYGIDSENPYAELKFTANVLYSTSSSRATEQHIMVSPKTKNSEGKDIYYVYNVRCYIVSEVPASSLSFIENELSFYCEQYIFLTPYYSVDTITVNSSALSDAFVASGLKRVNDTFALKIADDATSTLTDVILLSTGETLKAPDSKTTGVKNFSYYYRVLLSLSTQVEVEDGTLDKIDLEKPDITITIKTVSGKEHVMCFYLYNSRQAYYTLDGQGRSYVRYDDMEKLLDSTDRVIKGELVNVGYTSQTTPTDVPETSGNNTGDKTQDSEFPLTTLIIVLVAVIVVGAAAIVTVLVYTKKRNKNKEDK